MSVDNLGLPSDSRGWIRAYKNNIEFAEKHLAKSTFKDKLAWKYFLAINKRQLSDVERQLPRRYEGESIIQKIKGNVDIVDIIRRYTKLSGNDSRYYGLCPLHEERTPSLSVDSKKQLWHCFGCGKGGDIIDFVKLVESVDAKGAIKLLSGRI